MRDRMVTHTGRRWHARYCGEVPDVGFEEAQAVLACLAGLADRRRLGRLPSPFAGGGRREKDGRCPGHASQGDG
jgi:hypothetical protein